MGYGFRVAAKDRNVPLQPFKTRHDPIKVGSTNFHSPDAAQTVCCDDWSASHRSCFQIHTIEV